jgi:hypothetical protein
MKYEVVWRPVAEGWLADLWAAGPDRAAVAAAANEIDHVLASRPWDAGEARAGTTRILIEEPLAILYEVVEDDRRVYVLDAWRNS